ncbi:MAG TPA: SUKH-4 family immunity protein [Mycobacterium sp.]|nr:SUKH-4 family immunity protein [Mycobacterium sp.]
MPGLYDDMLAIVAVPLETLVDTQSQVRVEAVIDLWDLPESDRQVLRAHGLPGGPLLHPSPQADARPALMPNVAGELERRLISADQRLYRLGSYGTDLVAEFTIHVGAVAGTGQVLGIRRSPVTTEDFAEPLRPYYPDLYHPAVHYFNASVAAFVEIAWRWHAAVELLRRHAEPHYSAPVDEHEAHRAEQERALGAFLAAMTALDPTLDHNGITSLWVQAIIEDP